VSAPRRRFLAAMAAAPLLPAALAQTPPAPTASPSPAPAASPTPPLSPEAAAQEALADALTEAARRRFGETFPAEHGDDIRQEIAGNLRAASRLKALGLGNADEPVTVFEAVPPAVRSPMEGTAAPPRRGGTAGSTR
jgi:hypothetical protein